MKTEAELPCLYPDDSAYDCNCVACYILHIEKLEKENEQLKEGLKLIERNSDSDGTFSGTMCADIATETLEKLIINQS